MTLVAAACNGAGPINLPTHHDWGGASPATPQAGRLVQSGDCVFLVDDPSGGRWLVVWPPGTTRNGGDLLGSNGNLLARVGDEVSLEGGEYLPDEVGSQLTEPIATACQTDAYWLVADVTVAGSPAPSS